MALKALLLRRQLDDKRKALEALRARDADFARREAELESAIGEAESDEDRQAVEDLVEEFETDETAHEAAKSSLEGEVAQLEQDLAAEEAKQAVPPPATPKNETPANAGGERKDERIMPYIMDADGTRHGVAVARRRSRGWFFGLDRQERGAFLAQDDVRAFLSRVRDMIGQQRAVTGAELTIPDSVLDLLRRNIDDYSKLLRHVRLRRVPGTARQNIMGTIPEAIWTEACAVLNELSIAFSQAEVDGYKIGGFVAICNATKADSDLNLAYEIIDAIGQGIGLGVDKSIVYGTGVKMPTGFVTRLAQTAKPTNWGSNRRPWVDLHTSNIKTITGKSGVALFQTLILETGAADDTYATEEMIYIMNRKTKRMLMAEALSVNAAGAIVSGLGNTMPVLGGEIITEGFMADGDIAYGYGELYLMAERSGGQFAQSEEFRFVQDQTVFKGTARYDGVPLIAEAFGILNINGTAPTTSVTFPPDTANAENP